MCGAYIHFCDDKQANIVFLIKLHALQAADVSSADSRSKTGFCIAVPRDSYARSSNHSMHQTRCVALSAVSHTEASASALNFDAHPAVTSAGRVWLTVNNICAPAYSFVALMCVHIDRAREVTQSKLMKVARQRFKKAKTSLVMRFSRDGKSGITLVVWDFGGQKVGCARN